MHDTSFLDDLSIPDERVTRSDSEKDNHSADWGTEAREEFEPSEPDAVVYPVSTKEVSEVVAACHRDGVPVTPYAAGTSLEGNPVPVEGGVSLDLMRMNDVVEVRPDDLQVVVQPGVLGSALNAEVEKHGLFLPPLPSSADISTIGGMLANDAGGMQTVKYGKVGDWVLSLEVVLPDGTVTRLGGPVVKSSSGYSLKDIFVGSEGTLGVITEAVMELEGLPEQVRGGRGIFPSLREASEAVSDAVSSGVDVAKIELVSESAASMANSYLDSDLPDKPMVFVEFHANHGVDREVEFCRSIFESHGFEEFTVKEEEEMREIWDVRRELGIAIRSHDPELVPVHAGDVTVPIGRYPDLIRYIDELAEDTGYPIPCFGHSGDGNVHYIVLVEKGDDDQRRKGNEIYDRVVEKTLELDGTVTGEHGVGLGKRKYMKEEHGEALKVMKQIKEAIDPDGLLNPGKVFPD